MRAHDLGGERLNPVALITGAASGIGAATAQRLAGKATGGLILIDSDEAGLDVVCDALDKPPERVSTLAFNVSDADGWRRAISFISDQYGRLDWAVINAGISHSINLDGAFLTMKSVTSLMRSNAAGGAVVATALASGNGTDSGAAALGASRAGLLQLVRTAARDGALFGTRVNAIAPGGGDASAWRNAPLFQDLAREWGSERAAFEHLASLAAPMARYAESDDVARLIELLLIEATTLSGASLVVDGGYPL